MWSEQLERRALAALSARDFKVAEQICDQLLARDRNHPAAWYIGAVSALEAGQPAEALRGFAAATQLAPDRADYWAQYARCQAQLGHQADALASVSRAEALSMPDAPTSDTLGNVLMRLGRYAEALPHFERAAGMDAVRPHFQYNLATALMFCGDLERSQLAYQRVLEIDPDHCHAWIALVDLTDDPPADRSEQLEAALARAEGDVDRSLLIGHALARTLEASGDTDRAFTIWKQTKDAKKASIGYSIEEDRAVFSAFSDLFATETRSEAESGDPSDAPIFIIGMPRTGTTLLERMLASHSAIASGGESVSMPLAVREAGGSTAPQLVDTSTLVTALASDPAAMGKRYLELASTAVGDVARFTDKLPLNFFYVGFIRRALPNARIICLRRGALDTCIASFRQLFALNFPHYRYALSLDDTAEYVGMFEDLLGLWDRLYPGAICHVRYEDLVQEPEAEVRQVLDTLDLGFEPGVLDFDRNEAPVATASAVQVRRPVHTSSVGAWRRYADHIESLRRRFEAPGDA